MSETASLSRCLCLSVAARVTKSVPEIELKQTLHVIGSFCEKETTTDPVASVQSSSKPIWRGRIGQVDALMSRKFYDDTTTTTNNNNK